MTPGREASAPLRVLYDFVIFRMEEHGGISRYITELARRLAASGGAAPTIFAGLHGNAFVADANATRGARVLGARITLPRARTSAVGALDYGGLQLYRAVAARHDVYHPSYYPRRVRRRRGEALVATVYDMIHERLPEFHRNDPTAGRKRALVDAADRVLCISETTAADLCDFYGVDRSKIVVTHLGAPEGKGNDDETAVRADGRPFFLYVGRRAGYKNFNTLLDAYLADRALRSETTLIAIGGGEWTAAERDAIRRGGSAARVERIDADDSQLWALYRGALALCVPSLYEGFGLPVVEAMAAGCPVIANATGSLPEIVGSAGIVVAMSDAGVMTSAMRQVAADGGMRAALRRRGRERAGGFSWETTAARTLEAYQQAVGSR